MKKINRGLTLIEILVVIAVIGILTAIILPNLNASRTRARDATRVAEVSKLSGALEQYYAQHQEFPSTSGGIFYSHNGWGDIESDLSQYLSEIPSDPTNNRADGSMQCGTNCGYFISISSDLQHYKVGTYLANPDHERVTGETNNTSHFVVNKGCIDERWGFDCTAESPIEITPGDPTAPLPQGSSVLNVTTSPTNGGTVRGERINCGETCQATFADATVVPLTAIPADNYGFAGWDGTCSKNESTCNVLMTGERNITANFVINKHNVNVEKNGTGTVRSPAVEINCGRECTSNPVDYGTEITLTAEAGPHSTFTSWTDCPTKSAGAPCKTLSSNPEINVTVDAERTVTATFTINKYNLNVSKVGTGTVTSNPSGISCGTTCTTRATGSFEYGTPVRLTATPGTGFTFKEWSGGCNPASSNICNITMGGVENVTANFENIRHSLIINRSPSAGGTVSGAASGSTHIFNSNVTLTASPATGYSFTSWTGCNSTSGRNCTVRMDANKIVTANFTPLTPTLTINRAPTAGGTVSGAASGSTHTFNSNVRLTANPATGYTFTSWTGCNSTSGTACNVTMNSAKTVTANFTAIRPTLTINRAPTPGGTVSGATSGSTHNFNANVTLTANPAAGYTFTSWGGCNSASGRTCNVTMSTNKTVTANFTAIRPVLTINRSPSTSAGTVSGATSGSTYTYNASVSLTANPATGYSFSSWTGCTPTNNRNCTVTMNANKTVRANFTLNTHSLSITKGGTGSGTVTSNPSGINCGSTCSRSFNHSTSVRLTASPTTGNAFTGWSGSGCSGTGTCTVSVTQARSVRANFSLNAYNLTVSKTGTGSGTVTSSPSGISCGGTCTRAFNHGTSVTLSANPSSGHSFAGWSGACSGTGSCTVSMTRVRNVTARFNRPLTATISGSRSGAGNRTATYSVNISGGNGNSITYSSHTCGGVPTPRFPYNPNRGIWTCSHSIWWVNPSPIRVIIQQSGGSTLRKQFNWSNGSTTNW